MPADFHIRGDPGGCPRAGADLPAPAAVVAAAEEAEGGLAGAADWVGAGRPRIGGGGRGGEVWAGIKTCGGALKGGG